MSHPLKHHFRSDVPEPLLDACSTKVEKHLLEVCSVMRQQNEALIDVTIEVQSQTTRTNGRVDQHTQDLALIHKRVTMMERYVHEVKKTRKWMIGLACGGMSIVSPVIYYLVNHLLGQLFLGH